MSAGSTATQALLSERQQLIGRDIMVWQGKITWRGPISNIIESRPGVLTITPEWLAKKTSISDWAPDPGAPSEFSLPTIDGNVDTAGSTYQLRNAQRGWSAIILQQGDKLTSLAAAGIAFK